MLKPLLISAALLIGACTAPLQAPSTTELPPPPLPAAPRPMVMLDLEWNVVFDEEGEVWAALKIQGYESLGLNFAEIERYIEQLELNNEYLREQINPSKDSEENS
jgi:hypothetical protein